MNEVCELVTLTGVEGLGCVSILKIARKFSCMTEFLEAPDTDIEESIRGKRVEIRDNYEKYRTFAEKQFELSAEHGVQIVTYFDARYPSLLKEVYDAPAVLYVKGNTELFRQKTLAIVGTRLASDYGKKTSAYFAKSLAGSHVAVVSGMARGIDSAAHWGALDAGGGTIAVIGCGINVVYPPENAKLKQRIEQDGLIVSEYPMGMEPLAHNFPRRNRIISGISYGTIVIEAGMKSGALITARTSTDQGREVFAIPGSIYNKRTAGSHYLIRQGAVLVENIKQVFDEIPGWSESAVMYTEEEKREALAPAEQVIWDVMSYEPVHIDTLAGAAETSTSDILSRLLAMELKGFVKQLSGMMYIKV